MSEARKCWVKWIEDGIEKAHPCDTESEARQFGERLGMDKNADWRYIFATAEEMGIARVDGEPKPDAVNHPAHYRKHPSGVECITVTEHFNFNRGNAIKYIWRADEKGDVVENLKKARWYIDREISRIGAEAKG